MGIEDKPIRESLIIEKDKRTFGEFLDERKKENPVLRHALEHPAPETNSTEVPAVNKVPAVNDEYKALEKKFGHLGAREIRNGARKQAYHMGKSIPEDDH